MLCHRAQRKKTALGMHRQADTVARGCLFLFSFSAPSPTPISCSVSIFPLYFAPLQRPISAHTLFHIMSVTRTKTATSASGFTALSAEQLPPVQQFRVGKEGTIVPVEAEWDKQLQQFCYHVDELKTHLGVEVDHVRRAKNGVYVNKLRDQNDEMYDF